uniref:Gelsolin-like domain-containing protein n=2 Tax=Hucho hucho TaxID=62062 RepID=A0A4W5K3M8_9TELE
MLHVLSQGCSGDEREMAKAVSDVLSRQDKQVVMEGQEPAEFWVALGGKAPYACDKRLQKEETPHSPRLFECSNQTGVFRMTEVEDLAQEDLDQDDVMLLDTWEEIFLWIGRSANEYETKEACNSALEYLRTHPAGRDPDTPIISVKQGYEPLTFTGWFNAWDPHKWSVSRAGYHTSQHH